MITIHEKNNLYEDQYMILKKQVAAQPGFHYRQQ